MAARLVRLVPAHLVAFLVVAGLSFAALFAALAPTAHAFPSNEDYWFMSAIGPTYAAGHSFVGGSPEGVAVDPNGTVYVTLPTGIAKFSSSGTWLGDFTADPNYGSGYTMGDSYGLDVDFRGILYVAETNSHRVAMVRLDSYGQYHLVCLIGHADGDGTPGTADGEFNHPSDAAYYNNYLYVTDKDNNRIQKFAVGTEDNSLTWVATWGSSGSGDGQYSSPTGIAADGHGNLFIADAGNHRLQELTTSGTFVTKWGSLTAGDSYMNNLKGVDVDADGNVYVVDSAATTSWVKKFRLSGGSYALVTTLGSYGSTYNQQFQLPWGVAVAPNGFLYVADALNNKLKKFGRDLTPPQLTVSGVPDPPAWTKNDVTVQISGTDPVVANQATSGFGYALYSLTGGPPFFLTYFDNARPTLSAEGDTPFAYVGTDNVFNWTDPVTVHIRIDKTAPTTSISSIPSWSTVPLTVTFTPGDALSGVPAGNIHHSTSGGVTWTTGSAVTISAEGTTNLWYHSTDLAGNDETTQKTTVHVDSAAPTTTCDAPAAWGTTPVTMHFTRADATSGVAKTEYSTNGGAIWAEGTSATIGTEGATTLNYRSTDVAGNVETAKTATVLIDRTPPSTTVTRVSSVAWSKTPVTLTFLGSDTLSGWASTQYSTNGGATWTTGSSVRIAAQGTTTVPYRSTDTVGNLEATKTASVQIDGIKPVPKALANATVKRGKTVKLRYRVNDPACPQATVTIKIYKGTKKVKTLYPRMQLTGQDLSFSYKCKLAKGKYTWKVYATDPAGNVQVKPGSKTLTVR